MKSSKDDTNLQVQRKLNEVVQTLEISRFGYATSNVKNLLDKRIDDNDPLIFIIFRLCFHLSVIKHTYKTTFEA